MWHFIFLMVGILVLVGMAIVGLVIITLMEWLFKFSIISIGALILLILFSIGTVYVLGYEVVTDLKKKFGGKK